MLVFASFRFQFHLCVLSKPSDQNEWGKEGEGDGKKRFVSEEELTGNIRSFSRNLSLFAERMRILERLANWRKEEELMKEETGNR